jgi:glucose-6-phosphate isomerase, archaeal
MNFNELKEFNPLAERSHLEMKDVLMCPAEHGPSIHYYMIRGGKDAKNITVWQPGTVGEEFIKSYGHYHIIDIDETYEILFGTGILLLQERKKDDEGNPINNELEYIKAIYVKAGTKIEIPKRAGHLMINTGSTWLVTADNSPVAKTNEEKTSWPVHADYSAVKELHGFGYYVIKENNEHIFVRNENYNFLPEIEKIWI